MFFIYVILDAHDNIKYVGQSNNPNKRFNSHKWPSKLNKPNRPLISSWISKQIELGNEISIVIIDKTNDRKHINILEKYYIKLYRKCGCDLLNETSGGQSNTILTNNLLIKLRENNAKNKPVLQYDLNGNFIREYISIRDAARYLNVHYTSIKDSLDDNSKSVKGYMWCTKHGHIQQNITKYTPNTYDNIKQPVLQYDLNGNFIKEYSSAADAAKQIGVKTIYHSCNNNYVLGESLWFYKENNNFQQKISPYVKHETGYKKVVLQYDLNGNFIKEYQSVKEAAMMNDINNSHLSMAIRNNKICKGYGWKYK